MVAREVKCPSAAEQQQAAEGSGIEGTLAPVDAAHFALVEARQFGFGKITRLSSWLMKRAAAAERRQRAAGQTELAADAGGERIERFA